VDFHEVNTDSDIKEISVEMRTDLTMVSVLIPYCSAITNGIAPQGPAATNNVFSPQLGESVTNPAKINTSAGWKTIFAVTTDQVFIPIGLIGLLARMIPSANSDAGAAAPPAKAA